MRTDRACCVVVKGVHGTAPLVVGTSGASGEMTPPPRVAVLGPLRVEVGGTEVSARGARQRRLLTVLATATGHGRSLPADELIDAVYGRRPPQRARHSLATELWRARQLLGAVAIVTERDGHRLDTTHCTVDVIEFETLLAQGRTSLHARSYVAAQQELHRALSLWRGDPLTDWCDHPTARAAADRLVELRLGCTEDHADALIRLGRQDEAIDALETLTTSHPAREHAWALLIEACVHAGHDRRARAAFDGARRTLAGYGIEIGTELRAAHDLLVGPAPVAAADGLVGRATELAAVTEQLQGVLRRAHTGVIVISGEAGIGKSALAERAAAAAIRGTQVRVERLFCDQRLDVPLAALAPLLTALADHAEFPPALARVLADGTAQPAAPYAMSAGPAQSHDEIAAAVATVLEHGASVLGGLIVLVEDAQWASAQLLDILLHVLARRGSAPLALLVTVRAHARVSDEVAAALLELRNRAPCRVELAGLDPSATAALLGSGVTQADAGAMHRRTGGNPLYVRLITPTHGATVRRGSLADAIEERLSTVPADARRILALAAVAGTRFDLRVLTAAASQPGFGSSPLGVAEALDAADAAGLVCAAEGGEYDRRFVHVLVRDHLHTNTPAVERRRAHALIGTALERVRTSRDSLVGQIAHHYASAWPACPTRDVVRRLRDAGEQASRQLGFSKAATYYRKALDIVAMDAEFCDDVAVADLLDASARTSIAAASGLAAAQAGERIAHARRSFVAMHDVAQRSGLIETQLRADLGSVQTYPPERIEPGALDQLAATAAAAITGSGCPAVLPDAIAALMVYRPRAARDLLERAVAAFPECSGRLLQTAWAHETIAGKLGLARRLVGDVNADPRQAWLRLWVSEVTTGERALDEPPPRLHGLGESPPWEVRAWRTAVAIATGRFARADTLLARERSRLAECDSTTEITRRSGVIVAQQLRIAMTRTTGRVTADQLEVPGSTWAMPHPVVRTWKGYVAACTGERELARQVCDQTADELEDGLMPDSDLLPQLCALSLAAVAIGHGRAARLCRAALAPHAGRAAVFSVTTYWGFVDLHLGRLAALAGDFDAAVTHLHDALRLHRRTGARSFEALSLRSLSTALWHRGHGGDRNDAHERHAQTTQLAEELGMTRLADAAWPPRNAAV